MPKQNSTKLSRISKRGKRSTSVGHILAKLALSVALALSVSCATAKPRVEIMCPFPCRNADMALEELNGALDDAPKTFDWIGDVEFECGCTGDPDQ